MNYNLDPTLAEIEIRHRHEFVKSEFRNASEEQAFVLNKISQGTEWVKNQVSKLTSGFGQSGTGSLQPSA
ncbi:MAG: hypothetical protein AAF702_46200 [Chloroflexota bacterium]